jgi:ankyrin repeat protein
MPRQFSKADLQRLLQAEDVAQIVLEPKLVLRSVPPTHTVEQRHKTQATEIIANEKSSKKRDQPFWKTARRKQSYTFKLVTDALPNAIAANEPTGVIQALLDVGGNPSCVKNAETRNSLETSRSALLLQATSIGNLDTISLLAYVVPCPRLDEALAQALAFENHSTVRRLLEHGANPNSCSTQIMAFAATGQYAQLALLQQAPRQILAGLAFAALNDAVTSGCSKTLSLLASIADLHGHPAVPALSETVRRGDFKMLLIILSRCSELLRSDLLDKHVLEVFANTSLDPASTCLFIDALLYAGADGDDTNATFCLAMERGEVGVVELFIKHKVDINWPHGQAKAACFAARTGNTHLLQRVFSAGSLSNEGACRVLAELSRTMPASERLAWLKELLHAGARGPAVDEALLLAVRNANDDEAQVLRHNGARIDTNATALVEAINANRPQTLAILLNGNIEAAVLQRAFPALRRATKDRRFEMTKMLLDKGARGEVISAALSEAVCDQTETRDERLIELLINAGADPSFARASSFRHVVSRSDLRMFSRLLHSPISTETAADIVSDVATKSDTDTRYQFYQQLITGGAPREGISRALVLELSSPSSSTAIVELLLVKGNADISFDSGRALTLAAAKDDESLLSLLVSGQSVSSTTVRPALISIIQSNTFDDEKKASRIRRLNVTPIPAYEGIITLVQICAKHGTPGCSWPLAAFSVLIDQKPDVNAEQGRLLREAIAHSALSLLRLLLNLEPSQTVLDMALMSCMPITNEETCIEHLEALLKCQPTKSGISRALLAAFKHNRPLSICKLLLNHGGDLEYGNHQAVIYAFRNQNADAIQLIGASNPSQQMLETAFNCAIQQSDPVTVYNLVSFTLRAGFRGPPVYTFVLSIVQAQQTDIQLLQLCIDHGAMTYALDSQCATHAAVTQKLDVLRVLAQKGFTPSIACDCIRACVDQGALINCSADLVAFLLAEGAHGPVLSAALLHVVVNSAARDRSSKINLLLRYGADVNASNGEVLSNACEFGDLGLVLALAQARSTALTRAGALYTLIDTDPRTVPASAFCAILDVLRQKYESDPVIATLGLCQVGHNSTLRVLLTRRPRGRTELQAILDAEPELLQSSRTPVALLPGVRLAHMNASTDLLHWALEAVPRIETSLLDLLISKGIDIGHSNGKGETAVMVAIRTGRSELIDSLRMRRADISCRDHNGRSPLLHAVEQGEVVAIEKLVPFAKPDDGSLHQAIRTLNPDLVGLLLDHGHDATMPSQYSGHGKHTPIMELLQLNVDPSQHYEFKQIVRMLVSHGADLAKKVDNKPLICAALDQGYATTEALLAAGLKTRIDEDWNNYNDGLHCYSPTQYAVRILKGSDEHRGRLLELLRTYGAQKEIYYRLQGPQPDDAVGMPPHLERLERQRREKLQREQDAQEAMERERENRKQQQQFDLMLEQERHDQSWGLRQDTADREATIRDANHRRQLGYTRDFRAEEEADRELEAQARAREQNDLLNYEEQRNRNTLNFARQHRNLEVKHRKALLGAENDALHRQMQYKGMYYQGKNAYEEEQHRRIMARREASRSSRVASIEDKEWRAQQRHQRAIEAAETQDWREENRHERQLEQQHQLRLTQGEDRYSEDDSEDEDDDGESADEEFDAHSDVSAISSFETRRRLPPPGVTSRTVSSVSTHRQTVDSLVSNPDALDVHHPSPWVGLSARDSSSFYPEQSDAYSSSLARPSLSSLSPAGTHFARRSLSSPVTAERPSRASQISRKPLRPPRHVSRLP